MRSIPKFVTVVFILFFQSHSFAENSSCFLFFKAIDVATERQLQFLQAQQKETQLIFKYLQLRKALTDNIVKIEKDKRWKTGGEQASLAQKFYLSTKDLILQKQQELENLAKDIYTWRETYLKLYKENSDFRQDTAALQEVDAFEKLFLLFQKESQDPFMTQHMAQVFHLLQFPFIRFSKYIDTTPWNSKIDQKFHLEFKLMAPPRARGLLRGQFIIDPKTFLKGWIMGFEPNGNVIVYFPSGAYEKSGHYYSHVSWIEAAVSAVPAQLIITLDPAHISKQGFIVGGIPNDPFRPFLLGDALKYMPTPHFDIAKTSRKFAKRMSQKRQGNLWMQNVSVMETLMGSQLSLTETNFHLDFSKDYSQARIATPTTNISLAAQPEISPGDVFIPTYLAHTKTYAKKGSSGHETYLILDTDFGFVRQFLEAITYRVDWNSEQTGSVERGTYWAHRVSGKILLIDGWTVDHRFVALKFHNSLYKDPELEGLADTKLISVEELKQNYSLIPL